MSKAPKIPVVQEGGAAPEENANQRRDALVAGEEVIRKMWAENRVYENEAPDDTTKDKFMCCFPYPYMNGRLHLGHAFSLTKAEFSARFQRMQGKEVLFPFGFHCTGMPIHAAANKIKREMAMFGNPPDRTKVGEWKQKEMLKAAKKLSKKQETKQGKEPKLQWEILRMLNIPDEEIPAFSDTRHWLEYFPPLGKQDLQLFGASVDWRRSFITTSQNPFYDSFIQWQFRYLTREKYVKFGNRPSIFSELDGQICADHDRSAGEGVVPQQYTLIKIQVLDFGKKKLASLPSVVDLTDKKVFLVAATLRPETMYGQTNCFVLPTGDYGVFEINDNEYFICSARSAKNMSYQGLSKEYTKPKCVMEVTGDDLLGLPLKAPNVSAYDHVYCLPLLTISMGKGTGVVTSVPSDAPDDYAALRDLQKKPAFRAKYGITDEMVLPYDVIPILTIDDAHGTIDINELGVKAEGVKLGDRSAAVLCEVMGVASQNDKEKLKFVKDKCYKLGFNYGIMTVGKYAGQLVQDAKLKVRKDMIAEGLAADYYEPENLVMSRSGDECVVSFEDQWFLDYGEEKWREVVLNHVNNPESFSAYDEKVLKAYNTKLNWLGQWACSRQFGLGTRLPCDPDRFVIESLSDSTIYMAYYTVAHLLQGGVLNGSKPGPLGIKVEDMTDAVWDAIFLGEMESIPTDLPVSAGNIRKMKREFDYWYPLDLRVSGKDLIGNHLIMSLYNHAAMWKEKPHLWPRSFFTNGHVQVNGKKMSKSEGTFFNSGRSGRKIFC
jgi:leucyl-tRNA synthetase